MRFLSEKGGVDPRRLGAVGYGEFRPVADNATSEGRARNRRIAITILSEELAGADTAPGIKPFGSGLVPAPGAITNLAPGRSGGDAQPEPEVVPPQ